MNVLLPTDFSENADLASEFAFEIARRSGGKVTVLNAYDLPYSDRSMTTSLLEVMKENAEKNMEEYEQKLERHQAEFETMVQLGNPIRLIEEHSKKDQYDLIVMGTKGASGLEEILIGSNAASVIRNAHKPVLIIPPNSELQAFDKIVLASDLNLKKQEEALSSLRDFARIYKSKIDVVNVQKDSGSAAGTRDKFREFFGDLLTEFTVLKNDDIEKSIREEAKKEKANLVAAVAKNYGFFEGLFHRSLTSKLAYHTDLPLLVLHEPK